ncbi:NADH-quinone oxidoreductase subunit NuoG [Microbulbifer thermotolerans]|uniref:NADH-quinone oxidoreductase subunit NuoG n=1 Tax=Microbulbifer thermotolerans TaxID=252514 RepID=UPI002672E45A|nr:NADH-quinone oxidoreductase subunit NuoG [Microbulbifer thermotolerans]WKT59618.1 NADH-quinone oxidoreductase subunit NuoG [Microbulbifer thermotolerans]
MPTITIDGKHYQAEEQENLLSVCLTAGINLPYFCWHPAMGSVGACRQCAVIEYKNTDDKHGRLVMSCMTQVREGGIYSVDATRARQFRGGIIENLMTNHPHDCPVCEEGGECHLQDMTEMSGHTMRRFRGRKRTHRNQYLGPFINHEMNRCIACYRCTRFYRDYAGGTDLQPLARNNQVYFGRHEDGLLENGFSGNLVEVCPTGVFTDKTFSKHFVRKWDLQSAPSVCEHCAVGCNTAPGARAPGNGKDPILRRVVNLYNRDINGYFLCDRGRFGYDYVNSEKRIKNVLVACEKNIISSTAAPGERIHGEIHPEPAVKHLARHLAEVQQGRRRLIGIGSPRSSLENNFALRELVGKNNFFSGLSARDLQLLQLVDRTQRDARIHCPTTPEIESADAILILGEDIDNTAPRVALAVRQAARNRQKRQAQQLQIPLWQDASVRQLRVEASPIFFIGLEKPQLADITSATLLGTPEQTALFADSIAQLILGDDTGARKLAPECRAQVEQVANTLRQAENPLIISGCGSRSSDIIHCAGKIAATLADTSSSPCSLYLACPEVNSLGLTQFFPAGEGDLEQLAHTLEIHSGTPCTLIVLENDLYRRANRHTVERIFNSADAVILIDTLLNNTARHADLIFPAAATAESQGTYINSQGTAQRFYAVCEGASYIQESWRWLVDAANFCKQKSPQLATIAAWRHSMDLSEALAANFPQFEVLEKIGPDENYRLNGLKIARQSHRYSGRTALGAKAQVAELPPHPDPDAPMTFSMEGIQSPAMTPLSAHIWSPGWNSNQSIIKFQQEINGHRLGVRGSVPIRRQPQPLPEWQLAASVPAKTSKTLTAVPLYRLFGSDELSVGAAAIASVTDIPFAQISREDALRLDVTAQDIGQLQLGGESHTVEIRISDAQPPGTVGVPSGLPGLETLAALLPAPAQLERRSDREPGKTP